MRGAYAMPYSMSPCEFLQWADQSLCLKLHGFHAFSFLIRGMAKVRLVIVMTLDGLLPDENDPLMQWVKTSRHGFPYWQERSSFRLPIGYPMLNLIIKKESKDDSCIYLAEISDGQQIELLNSLLSYKVVDEWIIYHLPEAKGEGLLIMEKLVLDNWILQSTDKYRNNICRIIYHKVKEFHATDE